MCTLLNEAIYFLNVEDNLCNVKNTKSTAKSMYNMKNLAHSLIIRFGISKI